MTIILIVAVIAVFTESMWLLSYLARAQSIATFALFVGKKRWEKPSETVNASQVSSAWFDNYYSQSGDEAVKCDRRLICMCSEQEKEYY